MAEQVKLKEQGSKMDIEIKIWATPLIYRENRKRLKRKITLNEYLGVLTKQIVLLVTYYITF